jgi:hypothetical protein
MRYANVPLRLLVLPVAVGLAAPWVSLPGLEAVVPVAARSQQNVLSIVDELDKRRKDTQSVVARLKVVMHDMTRDREVTLDGAYLGDAQGNVRLRLKYGEKLLIDLAFRQDTVELWLPRRDRFFRGTRTEVLAQGDNDLILLANVGNAHDLFFPRAWTDHAVERRLGLFNGRQAVTVLEGSGSAVRRAKRLSLSPTQPVAESQEILNGGRILGRIQYADYRFPGTRAGESGGVVYPGRMTLTSKNERRSLEMIIDELHINTPIPSDKFAIELPEGQKVMPLAESLVPGKSLWE